MPQHSSDSEASPNRYADATFLRQLLNSALEFIFALDGDDRLLYANHHVLRQSGRSRDQVIGKPLSELFPERQAERMVGNVRSVRESGTARVFTAPVQLARGARSLETRLVPVTGADGESGVVFGFSRDVTDRVTVERALRGSEERFRRLSEAAFEGILIQSKGVILDANQALAELLGCELDQVIGGDVARFVAPESFETVMEHIRNGYGKPYQVEAMRADGSRVPVEVRGKSFEFDDETLRVTALSDITERKKLEADLLRAQKLESIGVLAGGIAHDFNNLLVGILGNVTMLKAELASGDAKQRRLDLIEQAALRARELTHRLLTFASGGGLIRSLCSLETLIRKIVPLALSGSNARAELRLEANLYPASIDEGQIGQVITNLLLNASEAMQGGGTVTVQADNVTFDSAQPDGLSAGAYVRIRIGDVGPGIPREILPRIFDPFFSTRDRGSGLGLTTCYSIVRNHQGRIDVASEAEQGTTVEFLLPATVGKPADEVATSSSAHSPDLSTSSRGRVLLMDDEPIVRELCREMLAALGFRATMTANGSEAVAAYATARAAGDPYDAVVLDLTVPGESGGEQTIERLLELDPDVRAIVSSGYAERPVMARFREFGFQAVLKKPYTLKEFEQVLRKLLPGDR